MAVSRELQKAEGSISLTPEIWDEARKSLRYRPVKRNDHWLDDL
jgi:hypothetical protein